MTQKAADAVRLDELRAIQTLLGKAGRALSDALASIENAGLPDPRPRPTPEQVENWIREHWVRISASLEAVGTAITLDATCVISIPLPVNIHERVQRGVRVFQDCFMPFTQMPLKEDTIAATVADMQLFFHAEADAPFYFKRLVEFATWRIGSLSEEIEKRSETTQVADLAELARSLWMPSQVVKVAAPRRRGRPIVGDPRQDAMVFDAHERVRDLAAVARQFSMAPKMIRLIIDREGKRRKRASNKPVSSPDKKDKSIRQHRN
jgi:hypothetical protein